ncbi:hypothetical protein RHGRI_008840 [Rhododendron griersonianum]|uniref:Uncharacterized protein n=1 Tax=Rhododendron griersonianum TaxID=479676 RepID=A0AAV6L3V2_9ERIC|nr:hypothetical protein RHGRI_008840 [Rhododendron griersonianum]
MCRENHRLRPSALRQRPSVSTTYFSEKSVACMLTFLFLSFYCLCYLFCIQPYTDFGTLDFLLSATLNQTLNLFGLRSSSTWLVVVMVACIIGIYSRAPVPSRAVASPRRERERERERERSE